MALGDRRGQPLAVRWDRTGWSAVRLPVPAVAAAIVLGAVSCASASSCAAAGYYEIGAGCRPSGRGPCTSRPLIERWDGRRWSVQRIPEPLGATSGRLTAVFCPTPRGCVATGFVSSISGGEPFGAFAERGTRTGWQVQRLVEPIYPAPGQLGQVSCATATSCTAVGILGGPFDSTLIEHWDGGSWRALSAPAGSDLHAVSCLAPAMCIAVGAGAEVLHGSTWTTLPSPATPLDDVSCISPTTCLAVGNAGTRAVAELWNDGRWMVTPTPNPTGAGYATLSSVSCASTTACIAVGYASYSSSPFSVPLVERWDGSTWSIQTTPGSTSEAALSGVSCASPTTCEAVGPGLAEGWDGSTWTIQNTPTVAIGGLTSVSCTSASACEAVGSSGTSTLGNPGGTTLAEAWNGASWSLQSGPNLAGGTLSAVSCVSATTCEAVGTRTTPSLSLNELPIAESLR